MNDINNKKYDCENCIQHIGYSPKKLVYDPLWQHYRCPVCNALYSIIDLEFGR